MDFLANCGAVGVFVQTEHAKEDELFEIAESGGAGP